LHFFLIYHIILENVDDIDMRKKKREDDEKQKN